MLCFDKELRSELTKRVSALAARDAVQGADWPKSVRIESSNRIQCHAHLSTHVIHLFMDGAPGFVVWRGVESKLRHYDDPDLELLVYVRSEQQNYFERIAQLSKLI